MEAIYDLIGDKKFILIDETIQELMSGQPDIHTLMDTITIVFSDRDKVKNYPALMEYTRKRLEEMGLEEKQISSVLRGL